MLLVFLWLLNACIQPVQMTKSPREGVYFGCRNYSSPMTSIAKPFYNFSFNIERDLDVGHFRPCLDILKSGVELILIPNNAVIDMDGILRVHEIERILVEEKALDAVFCFLITKCPKVLDGS